MTSQARASYLFLSLLQARVGRSVLSRLGDVEPARALEMSPEELAARARLTEKGQKGLKELRDDFDPDTVLARLAEKGLKAIMLGDEDYPERLAGAPDPPPALFVNGALPQGPPEGPACYALVGSRKASATGLEAARSLGRALGERGVCVVSGLALGIDAAAHEGALEAGGPVLGVLGCGVDVVYPKSNWRLHEKVAERGAVVSEYYLGEPPLQWRFPARNRVISGLSDGVVVVEAAQKSGALITARHALEGGRDVWAVPGPIGFRECQGSNALLADGAGVLHDVEAFAEAVAPKPRKLTVPEPTSSAVPDELPKREAAVLVGVGFEPAGADVVAGRSGVPMGELLPVLALLELKGYVARDASGAFVRVPT